MNLYLVRHATSTRAAMGVWGRLVDAPLQAGFETQLLDARSELATVPNKRVFASPLSRCLETARFVSPNQSVHVVPEFRAYHSGVFENETETFIGERNPEYLSLSYAERFQEPQFGEESIAAQTERVATGLAQVSRTKAETLVIVAHYSTINIIAHLCSLNWDQSEYANGVYDLEEGGFIRLAVDAAAVDVGLDRISRGRIQQGV